MMNRIATTKRYYDMDFMFGMFTPQLSEVFWDMCKLFHETFGYALELRPHILRGRAPLYADAISELGCPLDSCIGFIDCKKIQLAHPGGHNSMQRACFSGHKRFHCLTYQSLATPDGLIFA